MVGLVRRTQSGHVTALPPHDTPGYAFAHDRVQQVAYAPALGHRETADALHLALGRRLLQSGQEDERGTFFLALEQLNHAEALVHDAAERRRLARLNFEAGLEARRATAFSQARSHFRFADRFLVQPIDAPVGAAGDAASVDRSTSSDVSTPPRGPLESATEPTGLDREQALRAELGYYLAESEHLAGDPTQAEAIALTALANAHTPLLRSDVYNLLIVLCTLQGRYDEAIRIGRDALAECHIALPSTDLSDAAAGELRNATELLDGAEELPRLHFPAADEATVAALRTMVNLLPPTDFAQPELNTWLAARGVVISEQRGFSAESAKVLVNLGNALAERGDYVRAGKIARRAIATAERLKASSMLPRILYTWACYIHPWTNPMAECRALGERAFRSCQEAGEEQYAGYVLAFHRTINELFSAEPATVHEERLQGVAHFARRTRNRIASEVVEVALTATRHVRSPGTAMADNGFAYSPLRAHVAETDLSDNRKALCLLWVLESILAYVDGDTDRATEAAARARAELAFVSSTLLVAIQPLFEALAMLARWPSTTWRELAPIDQSRITEVAEQFEHLSALCESNFSGAHALLRAEIARVQGDLPAAMRLYDAAIASGGRFGFPPISAIAAERAVTFWSELDRHATSDSYLEEAARWYQSWHAPFRREALEHAISPSWAVATPEPDSSVEEPPRLVDAADRMDREMMVDAVVTVGGEIRLDELVRRLLGLLAEGTHADRVVLLLAQEGQLVLEADAHVHPGGLEVRLPSGTEGGPLPEDVPLKLLESVGAGRAPLVASRPWQTAQLNEDAYLSDSQISAVMCFPLEREETLVGLVYVENSVTAGAFSPAQIGVATFLAAQASLAITNALLVEQLEEKVAARTQELERRGVELQEALRQAERESRSKSALLTNVSHELRTPLNAIIGFSDTLNLLHTGQLKSRQADYIREREKDYIQDIYNAGTYLLELIQDLLDMSRLEQGRLSLDLADHIAEDILRAAHSLLRREASDKSIELELQSSLNETQVHCDARRIKQVLTNLIGNAVKFTPEGGSVIVRAARTANGLEFEVEDSGPGIPEVARERIFEPFERLAAPNVPGAGVGLTLSKRLVDLHNGQIWVRDSTSGGALFGLQLPVAQP